MARGGNLLLALHFERAPPITLNHRLKSARRMCGSVPARRHTLIRAKLFSTIEACIRGIVEGYMSTASPGTLLARASAAGKALNEFNKLVGILLCFALALVFVYTQSSGRSFLVVALLLGAPLVYLIYRAIRAMGKELRLYEGGLAHVVRDREQYFPWAAVRALSGSVPVTGHGQQGLFGGPFVVLLHSGERFYGDQHFEGLDTLVKLAYAQAADHLVPAIAERLHQGESVDLNSLRAAPAGLEIAGHVYSWASVLGITFDVETINIHTEGESEPAIHRLSLPGTYNAALLSRVVETMKTYPAPPEAIARSNSGPQLSAVGAVEEFRMEPTFTYFFLGGGVALLALTLGFIVLVRTAPTPPPVAFELGVIGLLVALAGVLFFFQWRDGNQCFIVSAEGLKRISREREDFVAWRQITDAHASGGQYKTYRIVTTQGEWTYYGGLIGVKGHERLFGLIQSHVTSELHSR
ncbi:MAG: hypothetical protein AB7K24_20185 [Gemmataceae bacterium]